MPWFKTDDSFYRHRKVRKLGRDKLAAVGLWQLAGAWCADNVDTNTADGFVPDEQVELWDARHRYAKRLVEVGLWERSEVDGEHGYVFHDWADYQPTRAVVEAEREAWRQRKERSREKSRRDTRRDSRRESREDSREESTPDSHESHAAPVPVPVPVPTSGHLGEGESPTERAHEPSTPHPENLEGTRPPERCPRHRNVDDPPNCGQCADHRRAAEAHDARHDADRQRVADEIDQARRDPRMRCEHGADGGRYLRPDTGQSATCAQCRRTERTSA